VNLDQEGIDLIQGFEQCRLTAYQDVGGIWTIGWGHTGQEVVENLVWTQAQADDTFMGDVKGACDEVNRVVTVPLTQGEFNALVSFVYNVGDGALEHSTMLMVLNEGDYQAAAAQFERWDHVSGKVCAGLLRRRKAEEQEFNKGDESC
jgi:lysozyme